MPDVRVPDASHPISIEKGSARVVVSAGETVLADSRSSLILREARYPEVYYIPRTDAAMDQLVATNHKTYCPYKGEAGYFSVPSLGDRFTNAIWTYENPFPAVAAIGGYLAFYADRFDVAVSG